jgi:hypothetical protein
MFTKIMRGAVRCTHSLKVVQMCGLILETKFVDHGNAAVEDIVGWVGYGSDGCHRSANFPWLTYS